MQLAKVVIASVLVLVECAEGLPEGKGCVKIYSNCDIMKLLSATLKFFAIR